MEVSFLDLHRSISKLTWGAYFEMQWRSGSGSFFVDRFRYSSHNIAIGE